MFLLQNQGLVGSDGISPASNVILDLKKRFADLRGWDRVKAFPSLFLLFPPSDFWLGAIPFLGMVTSVGVFITGAANAGFMLLLWLFQHSLFSIGQQWCLFGWDSQLLETGFLAIWLCPFWSCSRFPLSWPTPRACVWGSRWLVFRIMVGDGLYKLRNEGLWRNLTALNYQFETQPLPTPLSWYFHQHSAWLHVTEAVVCVVISCVVPFIALVPLRPLRLFGGITVVIFQLVAALSGNNSFSNFLTIVPAVMCIDDNFLSSLFPVRTLARLAKATSGCAGQWSCPHTQGWPMNYVAYHKEVPKDDPESQGLLPGNDGKVEAKAYSSPLTKPRSCFCWYLPDFVDFVKRNRMPRGTVDSAVHHIQERWWKIVCEVAVAAAIITCAMRLSASATYAVWEVIGLFFLVLLQAAFSAFVSRTRASYLFTEIILSFATIVSFFNLFFYGPEVWSVWLLSCLIAVLSIYAYSTLRNAALVTKVHVELLLLSLIVVLSIPVVQNLLTPQQIPNANFEPFQIVNSYGPVGTVQKERYELVVQGTDETELGANTKWKNYEFECKPTNLSRRPCFAAPYHHHLDWLMVCIASRRRSAALVFPHFVQVTSSLCANNSSVTSLLRHNPFAGKEPPAHIRVLRAQFRFTSSKDHGFFSSGPWWEISKGTTQVYIEPQEVPGAQAHLRNLIEERSRRKKEDEIRLKAEEEARRKAEEETELQRRLEAEREAAAQAKRQQEEAERMRREKEFRRKQVEEQKRKEELEKAEARKKKAQEEADAEKRREEKEAAAKAEETKAKTEAALRQREREQAEILKQKIARKKAQEDAKKKESERQRLEAERLKREEVLWVAREAQRQQEEEDRKHKREAEEAMQRQEEERRRGEEETRQREEAKGKAKEEEKAQSTQEARLFREVQIIIPGGVPLREAARLSKKNNNLRKRR
ncbi:hypothetical protein Esti_005771 [Eimeria stiedai]